MEAKLEKWVDWSKENHQTYPMLVIIASEREAKEYEAFKRLAEITKGLPGKAYQKALLGVQEDRLRGKSYLSVDLGTLLSLIEGIQNVRIEQQLATGWLRSFVEAKQKVWNPKDHQITCICGSSFKNEKRRRSHAKKCQVLKEQMPLLCRVKKSLDALTKKGKDDGKEKRKISKSSDSKSVRVRGKKVTRSKDKGTVKKKVLPGSKARRTKRIGHSKH